MKRDPNSILVNEGADALREYIDKGSKPFVPDEQNGDAGMPALTDDPIRLVEGARPFEDQKLIVGRMINTISKAEVKLEDARVQLGFELLELRRQVKAGAAGAEAAADWWGWFESIYPFGRRNAQMLMADARSKDPTKAVEDRRAYGAAQSRAHRERTRGKKEELLRIARFAPTEPEHSPNEPVSVRRNPPPRPLKQYPKSPQDAELITQVVALFRQLSFDGKVQAVEQLMKVYDEHRRGRP
jgi:hypothetical protein